MSKRFLTEDEIVALISESSRGGGYLVSGSAFFENGVMYSMSQDFNDKFVSKVEIYKNSNQFNLKVTFKTGIDVEKYRYMLQVTTNIFNWSPSQVESLVFPVVNEQTKTTNSLTWNIWQIKTDGSIQIARSGITYLLPNLE